MSDLIQDPYAGVSSEEEREAIYQELLAQHEQKEYERRKEIYSSLIDDWRQHRAYQQDLDHRSHRLISTFSAGSFGVSFAFISQLVELSTATGIHFLIASWALFAVTIIIAILELKIGSVIQDKLLDNVEKNIERGYEGKPYLEPNKRLIMWPGRFLGWLSVLTFIAGLICVVYFVLQNL